MAVVSSETDSTKTTLPNFVVHESFDLDDALALPWNFSHQIAASNSTVAALPTVISADHEDLCAVCMEGFPSEDSVVAGGKQTPCGHVYHAACISSWLSNRSSCPLCRCNISGSH